MWLYTFIVASYASGVVAALLLPVLLSLPPVALGWWALPLPLISPESQDPPHGGKVRISGSPDHSGISVLSGVLRFMGSTTVSLGGGA